MTECTYVLIRHVEKHDIGVTLNPYASAIQLCSVCLGRAKGILTRIVTVWHSTVTLPSPLSGLEAMS